MRAKIIASTGFLIYRIYFLLPTLLPRLAQEIHIPIAPRRIHFLRDLFDETRRSFDLSTCIAQIVTPKHVALCLTLRAQTHAAHKL